MRRIVLCIMLALALMTSAAAFAAGPEPIKIGYLAALTGEYAPYGIAEANSAKMVIDDVNASGGVLGRPLELVVYDTKSRPEDAVNAVRRMIESDRVVTVMGANSSSINLATAPLVDKAQIPQIGTATTNPLVTVDENGKVRPYSFRICFTDPYQGTLAAEFAMTTLGKDKAAILHNVGLDYAQGLREFFKASYTKLGGTIVAEEGYRDSDVDFRAQLATVKNSGANILFLPGMGRDMALIVKQARELGMADLAVVGGDGYGEFMNDIAGEAMIGTYWITHTDQEDPVMAPIFKRYEDIYKEECKEFGNVTLAYDLANWVVDAIGRAGAAEGPAIAKALADTKGLELKHVTLTMDENHDPYNKPGIILKIGDDMRSHFFMKVEPK
ncbi:MAG: ABC transporter substrate-binding protein [Synergistaceae bacterium]|nr:ABC transporter substrate-binding protein [Synergistaceae bacterium]